MFCFGKEVWTFGFLRGLNHWHWSLRLTLKETGRKAVAGEVQGSEELILAFIYGEK